MIDKLLGLFKSDIIKDIGGVIDGLQVSDEEKGAIKNKLTDLVLSKLAQVVEYQHNVILAEVGKSSWLTSSWRPIVMLTFTTLLVMRWMGVTIEVDKEMEVQLMELIKLGLGGYVIGRSLEQTAKTVTKNIDMTFLKKKDRSL